MGVQYNTIENVPVASFETSWKNESANQPIKSVVAEITPTQDLHGYDYPWPPGEGKNKLPYPYAETTKTVSGVTYTVGADGTVTVNGTATATSSIALINNATNVYSGMILSGSPSGATAATAAIAVQYWNGGAFSSHAFETGNGLTLTASDTIVILVQVNNGATINNMVFKPMIRAAGTDTTFTPYSNICPITGRTEATVWRMGKNLLDVSGRTLSSIERKDTIRMEGCTITKNGETLTAVVNGMWSKARFAMDTSQMIDGQQYTFSAQFLNPSEEAIGLGYSDGIRWREVKISRETSVRMSIQFVYDSSPRLVLAVILNNTPTNTGNTIIVNDIMLETGATATSYTPYSGTSYPVSWQTEAGEVYGGSVDVVSGLLTVTMANIASYNGETIGEPWLSSMDRYVPGATPTTGAQVVYTLPSPQTYRLTAKQINTLLGENNVWADSGNIKKLMWQYTIFDLLRVFINGFEITDFIAFGGWQRERGDVDGPEAGRTLDARMHRARVATKMRYNVTCRPLLVEELSSLERLIMPEYVTVKVIGDPYYGTWEKTCYVNNTSSQYLIRKRNGAQWWGGITFPIIEV